MKRFLIPLAGLLLVAPLVASAATTLTGVIDAIGGVIGAITPVVVALALLYFFWGLAKFILNAGSEEKQTEGRDIMVWGLVTLFVMISVWGLVQVLQQTFLGTTNPGQSINPPTVNVRR